MGLILKSDAFVNGAIAGKYGKESSDVQEGIPQLSFPISWEKILFVLVSTSSRLRKF